MISYNRVVSLFNLFVDRKRLERWADFLLTVVACAGLGFLLWMLLQVTSLTSFRIPTESMQPTLIPGDYILVEKWTMGGRIFDLPDAAEGKEVEIRRLPGFGKVERNDVLVFNFPHHHRWDSIGMDLMVYYVKRCIGLPGDTVSIRNGYYRVAGVADTLGHVPAQRSLERLLATDRLKDAGIAYRSFPEDSVRDWTIGDFGPLFIPSEGSRVLLTEGEVPLYRRAIEWEQKKRLEVKDGQLLLGDSAVHEYVFRKNYYFVGGDNVLYSQDSRYWGLLPEEYIVGRAIRIWKSVDKDTDEFRWERLMKRIE